jgi:predicted DNA-binding protein (UPF0251 family)
LKSVGPKRRKRRDTAGRDVVQFLAMSKTLTIRLTPDLAEWLADAAKRMGTSQGKLVRAQLQRAREKAANQSFMRLAGAVRGSRNLSSRKGFSRA